MNQQSVTRAIFPHHMKELETAVLFNPSL